MWPPTTAEMPHAEGKGNEFQRREAGTIASPAQRHPSRAELVAMYARNPDEGARL